MQKEINFILTRAELKKIRNKNEEIYKLLICIGYKRYLKQQKLKYKQNIKKAHLKLKEKHNKIYNKLEKIYNTYPEKNKLTPRFLATLAGVHYNTAKKFLATKK